MNLKRITDRVLDRLVGKAAARAGDPVCFPQSCGNGGVRRCCLLASDTRCDACVYP